MINIQRRISENNHILKVITNFFLEQNEHYLCTYISL